MEILVNPLGAIWQDGVVNAICAEIPGANQIRYVESLANVFTIEVVHQWNTESAWGKGIVVSSLSSLSVEPWSVLFSSDTLSLALVQLRVFTGSVASTINVVNIDVLC